MLTLKTYRLFLRTDLVAQTGLIDAAAIVAAIAAIKAANLLVEKLVL